MQASQPRRGGGVASQVKNRAPAQIQVTAEQILREAHEFVETEFDPPSQKINDPEELADYRMNKRKGFEDNIRRQRQNVGAWTKYAQWEASQNEFERARSIYERALDMDYRNQTIWLKYAEFEMKNRFVNHARNIWDRAVKLLPRQDQFWYKYAYMEEMLGNLAGCRQIFERWMEWMPDASAWNSYIRLELRHNNPDGARDIFNRWVLCHPEVKTYIKFAKFESKHGTVPRAREVYERAMEELGEDADSEELFIAFAKFEIIHKEYERARVIYKYALDHIPKARAEQLYKTYTQFEKQHGNKMGVEDVILSKRRFEYEEQLKGNPHNYDVWFDYVRLEEDSGSPDTIREVYERAISYQPPVPEKRYWKRYIYLWINYAIYEELTTKDLGRARQVLEGALEIVPHKEFTFSKLWLMLSEFHVRRKDLPAARKVLGTALGKAPREKVFKGYIELELKMGEVDRCRTLYGKYLEFMPENCYAWSKFAELEGSLMELERARAIFEMAVQQPVLDMPEVLWKAYIDFEVKQKQYNNTRKLYKRLLQRTQHVKVWISRALFEASINETENAREVFREADKHLKQHAEKSERVLLLESWVDFETNKGTPEELAKVKKMLPRRVKKKRKVVAEDGSDAGWEEYYDYIFPDEKSAAGNLKLLEMARKWKKQKVTSE